MKSYIIEGGKKLEGEVKISGSKNASLPIIASCILNSNITKLYNVPNIHDTQITLKILKILGCKVKKNSDKIEINSKKMNKTHIPEDLMRQMRSTVVLAGAILGRFKKVTFSYPGGCDIGARPIDLHLKSSRYPLRFSKCRSYRKYYFSNCFSRWHYYNYKCCYGT